MNQLVLVDKRNALRDLPCDRELDHRLEPALVHVQRVVQVAAGHVARDDISGSTHAPTK